jgi:hypothetical protein
VFVKLAAGAQLGREQIRGIVHLVASSVEGLAAERVTVVDTSGRVLSVGGDAHANPMSPRRLELKAAVDSRIISDVTLIPMYEEVRCFKRAVDFIREAARSRKPPAVDLELVKHFYGMVTPEAVAKGLPYRKENPLHRLYYHDIALPDKIPNKMKKLGEWLASAEFTQLHPVVAASRLQFKILAAYPWTKNSDKVARLMTNFILIREGYLPAIVHSIERQRYYEALRHEGDTLTGLVLESLVNSVETTAKFFDEVRGLTLKPAS